MAIEVQIATTIEAITALEAAGVSDDAPVFAMYRRKLIRLREAQL